MQSSRCAIALFESEKYWRNRFGERMVSRTTRFAYAGTRILNADQRTAEMISMRCYFTAALCRQQTCLWKELCYRIALGCVDRGLHSTSDKHICSCAQPVVPQVAHSQYRLIFSVVDLAARTAE